jgi:hypothetical protein
MAVKQGAISINMQQETEVFVFPASFAQQRLWFLNQLAPSNPFYNVSTALCLTGSLNLIALKQTFNEIVQRHESLRTTFAMFEGELVQIIAPIFTVSFTTIDLQNISPTQQETAVLQLATEAAQSPFDLATGPLFKVTLLQLSETEHILLLNLHHIVADGWSIGVLIRELGTLYTAFVKNERSPLAALPLQYADFAEWQHQYLQGEVLATQLAYWRQQLSGITAIDLPTDRQRPAVPSYRGAKESIALSPALSEELKSLSQQEGATLFITLLAAFQILLYRYTGQPDIAVGTPIANRNRSEIEALIGFFVNSLVLRADLSGNPTFLELLHRVKNVAMTAYAYQDLPFEKLVEELHPDRELSRNPLFQISFSLQNTPVAALELPGIAFRAIPYGIATLHDFDSGSAKLDLECNLWEDAGSIHGQFVYSTDLFDHATIARMAGHFQTLLSAIVANPKQRLSDLPLLTALESQQLLIDWNETQKDYPQNECFQQLFEERVKSDPDAVAAAINLPPTQQQSQPTRPLLAAIGSKTRSFSGAFCRTFFRGDRRNLRHYQSRRSVSPFRSKLSSTAPQLHVSRCWRVNFGNSAALSKKLNSGGIYSSLCGLRRRTYRPRKPCQLNFKYRTRKPGLCHLHIRFNRKTQRRFNRTSRTLQFSFSSTRSF